MKESKRDMFNFSVLIFIIFSLSCSLSPKKEIIVASTTSLYDFGLVDEFIKFFKKRYGINLTVIPVGSGQALTLGRLKKVDAIISHLPEEEEKFMKEGFGIFRLPFAYNYFILVGPRDDPARAGNETTMMGAFKKIYEKKALFVSRGDYSGTHFQELGIWKSADLIPKGQKWYMELGIGMGQALIASSEKSAYTLTDKTTYLKIKDKLKLKIILDSNELKNIYSLIIIRGVESEKIHLLKDFFLSDELKRIIEIKGRIKDERTIFPFGAQTLSVL